MMIISIANFFFVFYSINGQQSSFNLLMPDLPSNLITHESHSFTTRSFTKISLFDGPFNVQVYQNINSDNNYTSVEVETEQSIHKFISIDIKENDLLTIRLRENIIRKAHLNITILIVYRELNELYIDGSINIQSW
jgi:hypothetical protein